MAVNSAGGATRGREPPAADHGSVVAGFSRKPWSAPCDAARRLRQRGVVHFRALRSALAVGLGWLRGFQTRTWAARTSLEGDAALHCSTGGSSSDSELLERVTQSDWRLGRVGVHKGDAGESRVHVLSAPNLTES